MSTVQDKFALSARSKFGNKMLKNLKSENLKPLLGQMGLYYGSTVMAQLTTGHNVQPGIMLGMLPLYAVEEFEVGKSDKQLKFRSIGGQFMAFQEGDNMSLRLRLRLNGAMRFVWLSLLDYMYLNGLGTYENRIIRPADVVSEQGGSNAGVIWNSLADPYSGSTNYIPLLAGNKSYFPVGNAETISIAKTTVQVGSNEYLPMKTSPSKLDTSLSNAGARGDAYAPVESTTPWKEIPHWQKRERILKHKTFNVITEEEVFISMYIETMIWSKTVNRDGRHEITVNLLLRRYVEPPERIYIQTIEKKWKKRKKKVNKCALQRDDGIFITEDEASVQAAKAVDDLVIVRHNRWKNQHIFDKKTWDGKKKASKRPFNDRSQVQDKQALKNSILEAPDEEIKQNLYKDVEDEWYSEDVKHKYIGTLPDDKSAGEFGMLAINILWRTGWFTREVFIGGYHPTRLSSDPLVGRLNLISNTTKSINDTETSLVGQVESYTGDEALISNSEGERLSMERYILGNEFGIAGNEISDVFVIPERQSILEELLHKGFKYYKLSGTYPFNSSIKFDVPLNMEITTTVHTDPYTEGFETRGIIEGFNILLQEGATYYIGNGDVPKWVMDNNGFYHINKDVLEEMYLYVDTIKYSNNEIKFKAYIISPAYGI